MKIRWLILAAVCLLYYGYIRQTTDLAMDRFTILKHSYAQAITDYAVAPNFGQ